MYGWCVRYMPLVLLCLGGWCRGRRRVFGLHCALSIGRARRHSCMHSCRVVITTPSSATSDLNGEKRTTEPYSINGSYKTSPTPKPLDRPPEPQGPELRSVLNPYEQPDYQLPMRGDMFVWLCGESGGSERERENRARQLQRLCNTPPCCLLPDAC